MGRRDLSGPRPVRYFATTLDRLDCRVVEVPGPWQYWDVYYDGEHRAAVMKGKGGLWFGLVFGGMTYRAQTWRTLGTHLVGVFGGRQ